jgi:antitoxin component YwqK of YwqJK toxin-antitoxin module
MSEESQTLDTPQGPSQQDLENALRAELIKQEDIVYGITGGLAAAIVSALVWALITVSTKYQIGYMAVGVGALVGVGVRIFGAGVQKYFGVVAAVLALFGCALGNVLSQLAFAADEQAMSYWEILGYLDFDLVVALLRDGFRPMDVLFYGLAVSVAYRISIRKVEEELVTAVAAGKVSPPPYSQYRLPAVIVFFGIIVSVVVVLYQNTAGPKTYRYDSGAKRSFGEMSNGRETGPWESYYENGTVMNKGFFDNGRPDSAWTYYGETGNILREGKFRKGLEEDEWTYYNEDGTVMAKGQYRYGRQSGPWTFFHKSGAVDEKGSYVASLRDGEWEIYFENGKLRSKGRFDYGQKVGVWTTWNEKGDKIDEFDFIGNYARMVFLLTADGKPMIKDGNGKYTVYHENGTVSETGMVKDGYREGVWKSFFETGKPMEEGEYRKGEYYIKTKWTEDGETMARNGSGQLEINTLEMLVESGKIQDGRRVGEWMARVPGTDSVITRMLYKDGKLNGQYTSNNAGAGLSVQGTFKDDGREGEWVWYRDTGAVESKVTFVKGKKEGDQLFFNVYDELLKTEVYKDGKLVETRVW